MSLYLEITEGDRKGSRFKIADGITIGRRQCDIILRDSKVSSRHARIEKREDGFYLVDLGSSNGLKLKGNVVSSVLLEADLSVQIGRAILTVIEPSITTMDEPSVVHGWARVILSLALRAKSRCPMDVHEVLPFNPLVRLQFVQGIQTGVEWTLSYGPREVGAEVLDLRLTEDSAPPVCFVLSPHRQGLRFQTQHSDVVKLNGKSLLDEYLSDGDVIEVGKTQIVVNLDEVSK